MKATVGSTDEHLSFDSFLQYFPTQSIRLIESMRNGNSDQRLHNIIFGRWRVGL